MANCVLIEKKYLPLHIVSKFDLVIDIENGLPVVEIPLFLNRDAIKYNIRTPNPFNKMLMEDQVMSNWFRMIRSAAVPILPPISSEEQICLPIRCDSSLSACPDLSQCKDPFLSQRLKQHHHQQQPEFNYISNQKQVSNVQPESQIQQQSYHVHHIQPEQIIPVRLIASENILQNQELLIRLRKDLEITFIERNLSIGEDLILDERTCLGIIDEFPSKNAIDQAKWIGKWSKIVARLSLKFETIWLVFHVKNTQPNKNELCNSISRINDLVLGLSQVDCQLVVRYSKDIENLVSIVNESINQTSSTSPVWNSVGEWSDRSWMLEKQTKVRNPMKRDVKEYLQF